MQSEQYVNILASGREGILPARTSSYRQLHSQRRKNSAAAAHCTSFKKLEVAQMKFQQPFRFWIGLF